MSLRYQFCAVSGRLLAILIWVLNLQISLFYKTSARYSSAPTQILPSMTCFRSNFSAYLCSAIWSVQLAHAVLPPQGHRFRFAFNSKSFESAVNNSTSCLNSISIFSFATNYLGPIANISLRSNPAWIGSSSYLAQTIRSAVEELPRSLIQKPQLLPRLSPSSWHLINFVRALLLIFSMQYPPSA